jgi:hypothetical protein
MHSDQSSHLTQFVGKTASPDQVAVITLLQLLVGEIHDASSRRENGVSDAGPTEEELKPGR